MEISSRSFADVVVFTASGRIDYAAASQFEQAVAPYLKPSAGTLAGLVFDFEHVGYVASVGLRVLMLAGKAMRACHGRIAVASLQPEVSEILQICRFDAVVETFPTVADALAAISPVAATAYGAARGRAS